MASEARAKRHRLSSGRPDGSSSVRLLLDLIHGCVGSRTTLTVDMLAAEQAYVCTN
jgi:hypothetical protein